MFASRNAPPRLLALALAGAACVVVDDSPARADECIPADPRIEVAHAQQAGHVVLTGRRARDFVQKLAGLRIPIGQADWIALFISGDVAHMTWLDDAAAPIAIRCGWEAKRSSPVGAIIEAAIGQGR
jgi:hypothetical protein